MRTPICSGVVVVSVLLAVLPSAAQETSADIATELRAAAVADAAGDYAAAAAAYREALRRASAAGVPASVRVDVSLNYAQTIEAWRRAEPDRPMCDEDGRATAAAGQDACDVLLTTLYESAVRDSTGAQATLARNNFGTWLLRRERYADALSVLSKMDVSADSERRTVYGYNQARALELTGRTSEALQRYMNLTASDPTFSPSADGAARVLRAASAPDAKTCSALVTTLLAKGQTDAAERVTRRLLSGPVTGAWGGALLGLRLRYSVAARLDRERLRTEQTYLSSLAADSEVRQQVANVDRVLRDGKLPLITHDDEAQDTFRMRSTPAVIEPFAAFVKYVGDLFSDEGHYQQALHRYLLAWQLDANHGESAVYAAALIRSHPDVDPRQEALDALLTDIFDRKGMFIAERDWPNSLRMHVVLGSIFEKLERWGPETNPRSALFQWKAAIDDENRMRQANRTLSPSPGLYQSLAEAYGRSGDRASAATYFERAARAFTEIGRPEDASRVARLAASMRGGQ